MRLKLPKETGDEAFYVEAFDCEVDGWASELHANFLNDDESVRKKKDELCEARTPERAK